MNSRELLGEIQRLNREDKLKILQFLSDELSIDIGQYFEGRNTFKLSPPFRATDIGQYFAKWQKVSRKLNNAKFIYQGAIDGEHQQTTYKR